MSLFGNEVPKTVENVRYLCTDEKGFEYKGSIFHHIIKNFRTQDSNFITFNGMSGKLIYSDKFGDENFKIKYFLECLSIANAGKNTNIYMFFICYIHIE